MKKVKFTVMVVLVAFLTTIWLVGCTGGGIFDNGTTPAPTGSVAPSTDPSDSPTPVLTNLKSLISNFVTGEANIWDVYLWGNSVDVPHTNYDPETLLSGFNVFWVENSTTPGGKILSKVFARSLNTGEFDTTKPTVTQLTGLNRPMGYLMRRYETNEDITKHKEFVYTTQSGSAAAIYRYRKDENGVDQTSEVQLTSALDGSIPYMALDVPYTGTTVYYVRDTGGTSSAVERVPATLEDTEYPKTPETIAADLSNAHHLYIYRLLLPENAKDPKTKQDVEYPDQAFFFLFVTEHNSSGRVLMYNLSEFTGTEVLSPVVVATGQQNPAKMTFIPDIEQYAVFNNETKVYEYYYGHTRVPKGYLYWTNFNSTTGTVYRARLEANDTETNMEVVGNPEIVARSLKRPYDIIGPEDFLYSYFTYNLGTISGTVTDADTGNPIQGVTIVVGPVSTITDSDGKFRMELSEGEYTLTGILLDANGDPDPAWDYHQKVIEIEKGNITTYNFALHKKSGMVAKGLKKPVKPETMTIKADPSARSAGNLGSLTTGYRYNTWNTYNTKGSKTFQSLYVSNNSAKVDKGNWYEIDLTKFGGSIPLEPGTTGVTDYITSAVDYPFNGMINIMLIIPEGDPRNIGKVFKRDIYFCNYNFSSEGNNDAIIYIQQHNFDTEF